VPASTDLTTTARTTYRRAATRLGRARVGLARRPTDPWPTRFPGAYLGWGANGPIFTGPEHHALIIGPPRSGKTTSIITPATALWPGPVVATSTKPDLLHLTNRRRQQYGTVWVWDPTGTLPLPPGAVPARWSPLVGCDNWATALERSFALVTTARPGVSSDHAHWTERATALLATLVYAAATTPKPEPLSTVISWLNRRETLQPLDRLLSGHPSHDLLTGIALTDPRELSGIYSTADSVLAAYRNPVTLTGADHPNFDPAAFATSTDTLYLVAPAAAQAQHAPIVCALLDQIRHHITGRAAYWPPMLWALDETANIAPLPTLPGILADAGSQGLIVLTCLQDLSQARARWGPAAEGFLTLHPTTLLLPGIADTQTLRAVTTLAGQIDQAHRSVTNNGPLSRTSTTTSIRRVPLLPENVIANGHPGYALRLCQTRPSWLALTPTHTTPWIQNLLTESSSL
jgi:type IV secretion system protein VirD4